MFLRRPVEIVLHHRNRTRRASHRDSVAVRRAHHHAFNDSLAANQKFLRALEQGQGKQTDNAPELQGDLFSIRAHGLLKIRGLAR